MKRFLCSKKIRAAVLCVVLSVAGCIQAFAFGGELVFDGANWLKNIEELYATYDMVTNALHQLENQYKQIQMAVDSAKGIDWSNVQWDGDFDIRDDIKNANKRVNRLLTNVRIIEESLTEPSIKIGNANFSIQDLCCASGKDGANITDAWNASKDFVSQSMRKICDTAVHNMSPEEKKAIWAKFGISPSNYKYVSITNEMFNNAAMRAIARVSDKAKTSRLEILATENSAILEKALQQSEQEGSQESIKQAQATIMQNIGDQLSALGVTIDEFTNLYSLDQIAKMKEKEAERQQMYQEQKTNEDLQRKLDARYVLPWNK